MVTTAPTLTWERLKELVEFDGGGAKVLSVYLDVRPRALGTRRPVSILRSLAGSMMGELDAVDRMAFSYELAGIERWLKTTEPRGHTLAIYSCTPQALWQRDLLPAHIASQMAYQRRVNLSPLLNVLEEASATMRELKRRLAPDRLNDRRATQRSTPD